MSILKVDEIQDTAGKKILQNTGGVLQVVAGTVPTSDTSSTSTSFVDATGHTVTITPTSSSSKILVLFTARLNNSAGSNFSTRGNIRILMGVYRNSTKVFWCIYWGC